MTRILVVADDPEITKLLEKFLSNEGYQVTVASNGASALSAASAAALACALAATNDAIGPAGSISTLPGSRVDPMRA